MRACRLWQNARQGPANGLDLECYRRWTIRQKKQTLTQRKLYRVLCNIEIWGLGVYLVGVCRIWSSCPSTVSCLYVYVLERSFCCSRRCIGFQHSKEPWPQRTMTAKHNDCKNNDCKEQWLQRKMAAKKEWPQRKMTERKAKPSSLQRAILEGCLARKLRFHIFNLQVLKKISHKLPLHNFNLQILKDSRTKASFSHLQGSPRVHIFNLQILKDARTKVFCAQLQRAGFEGSLAWKLRFHQLAARSRGKKCAAPQTRALPANSGTKPCVFIFEGSLEVKLPTIWRDEKQSRAEAERRGRLEERRSEEKE